MMVESRYFVVPLRLAASNTFCFLAKLWNLIRTGRGRWLGREGAVSPFNFDAAGFRLHPEQFGYPALDMPTF